MFGSSRAVSSASGRWSRRIGSVFPPDPVLIQPYRAVRLNAASCAVHRWSSCPAVGQRGAQGRPLVQPLPFTLKQGSSAEPGLGFEGCSKISLLGSSEGPTSPGWNQAKGGPVQHQFPPGSSPRVGLRSARGWVCAQPAGGFHSPQQVTTRCPWRPQPCPAAAGGPASACCAALE